MQRGQALDSVYPDVFGKMPRGRRIRFESSCLRACNYRGKQGLRSNISTPINKQIARPEYMNRKRHRGKFMKPEIEIPRCSLVTSGN